MTRILSPNIASPVTTSRQLKPEEISCSVASGDCTSAQHCTTAALLLGPPLLQLGIIVKLTCSSSCSNDYPDFVAIPSLDIDLSSDIECFICIFYRKCTMIFTRRIVIQKLMSDSDNYYHNQAAHTRKYIYIFNIISIILEI